VAVYKADKSKNWPIAAEDLKHKTNKDFVGNDVGFFWECV
jgi:hypothetical protein